MRCPQFSLLQDELSQSVFTGEGLQPSDHLCDFLCPCSKRSMSVLFSRAVELDVTPQVGPHQGRAEGQNPLPWCAGHIAIDAVGLLVFNCTLLLDHTQIFLYQNLSNPSPQGWFQWVHYSISTHVWDCSNSSAAAWAWTCWISLCACGSCLSSLSKSPGWHCFLLLWQLHISAWCLLQICCHHASPILSLFLLLFSTLPETCSTAGSFLTLVQEGPSYLLSSLQYLCNCFQYYMKLNMD